MTGEDELARIFNDSYERCAQGRKHHEERSFFIDFYRALLATASEMGFRFSNEDEPAQVRMMRAMLTRVVILSVAIPGDKLLRIVEQVQWKECEIPVKLYPIWMDCLIECVRRFDPKFNDQIEVAWRTVLKRGLQHIASQRR